MTYKILVVDDSSFFRRRVTDILNKDPNLEVIDVAVNGKEAVEKAKLLKPDVITMDIEMPVLNGIEAVKQIMADSPTAIIMFSSLTHQGAKATLEALDAGALDFLPKKFNEIAQNNEDAGSVLRQRVSQLGRRRAFAVRRPLRSSITRPGRETVTAKESTSPAPVSAPVKPAKEMVATRRTRASGKEYKLLAIGTSTGGPVALQKILTRLPADFPVPIIMVQHMPAAFTQAFANRLNSLCKIEVKEASDGDVLKPGHAYLAPGGRQMLLDGKETNARLKIVDELAAKVAYKPSVDISFGSAAKVFQGNVLGVILTGMGSDGRDGSRMLKGKGATIWAQDEETSVVYGMPQVVTAAGISELSLPLDDFAESILKEIQHG
ncbi:chemotaxis response regulator protein-glutamate methylesterase [Thalassomonas viridans]|uniref:Protein-glutamate methylesterase/protein-glutamine glutaminase n=1 Tax=Thalassomonas viridans TaxID=137584 RepID=A0AAE9YZV2_9GAMM|nr:chemotaxis response regulator protein-glutamate methylesterase [Thalassomonas viridans]WDE03963.1 chemotaxis response regulator protein-glutamate methylesterase [Thalassomonas viridans]